MSCLLIEIFINWTSKDRAEGKDKRELKFIESEKDIFEKRQRQLDEFWVKVTKERQGQNDWCRTRSQQSW